MNPDQALDYCEVLHGLPCEGEVEIPAHIDQQLPEGDLVEYADLISITYRWPSDGQLYEHTFINSKVLVGGPSVLYLVGDFTTEPEGIVNTHGDD
tara:strand:- start:36 stop:320 length:285 start_codon:yes stop_codon:yes gene_type:complete